LEYHVRSVESASRRVSSDVAVSKRVDGNVNMRILENTLENGSKINGRLRSIQTAHFGGLAALARESPPQSDPFVARRLIGSGVRKPLARRRERARASVGDSAGVAPGFPRAGGWTSGDDVRDPHPSGASGEMASDGAPALNDQTHANIGADAEVSPATPAVKDRIDRPDVPGTCLSLRTLEGTSGSPPLVPQRWALRRFVCASAATRRRAPGFGRSRFQKVFLRFVDSRDPSCPKVSRPLTTPRALFFFTT
jgi:hypothetical protein